MTPDLDLAYGVALVVTLWATAIGLGAAHAPREIEVGRTRPGLVARLVVLDVVIVPLVVVAMVRVFAVPTDYALGLLIVGTAAAGPLGLKTAQVARGDLPLAIGLVIALEVINLVAMPVWAVVLMPGVDVVPVVDVLRTLVLGVGAPLLIGFAIHGWLPGRSVAVVALAGTVSNVGLAALIALVLLRDGGAVVAALGSGVPAAAATTIVVAMALGWWLGGPDAASRRTGAMTSAVRANVLALAIATAAYGATASATASIVVFGLCSLLIVVAVAVVLGRAAADYEAVGVGPSRSRSAPTS